MEDNNDHNEIEMKQRLEGLGYIVIKSVQSDNIADRDYYTPYINEWSIYQPWNNDETLNLTIRELQDRGRMTLVNWDRLYILKCAFIQTSSLSGEVWESGVYQGGTALLLKKLISSARTKKANTTLRLFDTFEGMPRVTDGLDLHAEGDFSDTSLEDVKKLVGTDEFIEYHKGWIPETFAGLDDSKIRLAHIDVDIYQSVVECCEFIYPMTVQGGILLFDDYGFCSCPGARRAVDQFFANKPETPFVLPTGQAIVHKL